jgi:hypothetical protein
MSTTSVDLSGMSALVLIFSEGSCLMDLQAGLQMVLSQVSM